MVLGNLPWKLNESIHSKLPSVLLCCKQQLAPIRTDFYYYYYYYYYLLQVIYKAKQPVTPDQQVKKSTSRLITYIYT